MRKLFEALGRFLVREAVNLFRDACLVAGFFGVVHGLGMVWEPAAWVVGGAMLIWAGLPPKPAPTGGETK